jgi:hypothetical protein
MPRLNQRRSNIQYGGTKVSIREPNSSFTPCYDEEKIGQSLLHNTKSINLITDSSIGSCLFYGELVDDQNSLVLLESQTISKDSTSPLPLTDAKHVSENVGKGMCCQKFCMKVMLFNPATNAKIEKVFYPLRGIYKEVTNELTVKKEKEKQKKIYENSICLSGTDGEIVADGIASIVLTPLDFKSFFEKHMQGSDGLVYKWIYATASKNKLQVCIYFMDYLDGFIILREFLKQGYSQSTIYEVSNDIAAYILYILYITKEWSYDMHNGNIMIKMMPTEMYMLRFIDFGRTINYGDDGDNNYIKQKFEEFLNTIHSDLEEMKQIDSKQKLEDDASQPPSTTAFSFFKHLFSFSTKPTPPSIPTPSPQKDKIYEKMLLDDLHNIHLFFGVKPPERMELYDQTKYKDKLTEKFNEYLQQLSRFDLTRLHDKEEGKKYLRECIMFLSFIELIIQYVVYGKDEFQCSIMENIFMMKKKTDFSMFVENNRLKYDDYLSKNPQIKDNIEENFSSIYDKLKQLTSRCSSRSSTEDFRGKTRIDAIEAAKSVLEESIDSAEAASQKKARQEEAMLLISKDLKDTARWENFIGRGGSDKKRKYRSRRISKHSKSIKHRRYHYRHFTKRNLKIT